MERKAYIVPPEKACVDRILTAEQGQFGAWLYVGERVSSLENCNQWLEGQGRRLVLGEDLQTIGMAARRAFIEYIGALSTRYESPQWWLSSLAEKNPYISKVFLWLCHVLTVARVIERELATRPVLIVAEERCVRQVLADFLNTRGWTVAGTEESLSVTLLDTLKCWLFATIRWTWFLVHHGSRLVQARLLRVRHPEVWGGNVADLGRGLVLQHGWIDHRSFDKDSQFCNINLGELAPYLERHGWTCCLVPLIIPTFSYRTAIEALRRSGARFLLPHAWLTPLDLVRGGLADLWWQRPLGPFPRCEGVDLEPLILEDLKRDREVTRVATNWLYLATVERWRRKGIAVAGFVYSYENHLWERAFCLGFRRFFPEACLIGYQDANVPDLCLNFFSADCEWLRQPMPDVVITNGAYSADRLRRSGYPESLLRRGGAIRFAGSLAALERSEGDAHPKQDLQRLPHVVLVVPPSGLELASELVWKTAKALGEEPGIRVVLKCHPMLPFGRIAATMGGLVLPSHFQVSDRPFLELLKESGVLLYMDSTTCLEALAHGVQVIHVRSDWTLDLDTIGEKCQERLQARTPSDIACDVRWLLSLQGAELAERRRRGRQLVARYFDPAGAAAYQPVLDALALSPRRVFKPADVLQCRS